MRHSHSWKSVVTALVLGSSSVLACDPLGEIADGLSRAPSGDRLDDGVDDDDDGVTEPAGSTQLSGPDDDGSGSTDALPAPGNPGNFGQFNPGSNTATAPARVFSVALDVRVHTVVVLGSVAAEARFEWTTMEGGMSVAPGDAVVTIQMKSELDPVWRDILVGLEPNDIAGYSLPTYASQSFWFRAVAAEADGGGTPSYSSIVRVD
jgi:hypothetical protein